MPRYNVTTHLMWAAEEWALLESDQSSLAARAERGALSR